MMTDSLGTNAVDIHSIESIELKQIAPSASTETIRAKDLWAERPVLLFIVRRPGCIMCRELASDLSKHIDTISKELQVDVVAIMKENIPEDVDGFREYYEGRIYIDESLAFYRALTDGELVKHNLLFTLMKPALWSGFSRASKKGILNGSFAGEASINGGFLLVSNEGVHMKINEDVGFLPSFDDLMKCVESVSPASSSHDVKFDGSELRRDLCEDACALPVQ